MTRFALLALLAACTAPLPMEAPAPGVPDPFGLACLKQGGSLDVAPNAPRRCHPPG